MGPYLDVEQDPGTSPDLELVHVQDFDLDQVLDLDLKPDLDLDP